ncbi:MAG: PP2C family protein-serine/threonine phosphatase, partial [Acidobacteriota bacterium]
EEATYGVTRLQLQPDDTLVLFTDGIIEAANTQKELFGFNRLREVAAAHTGSSIEGLQNAILHAVEEFSRGAGQADDITLLIVRFRSLVNPAAPA